MKLARMSDELFKQRALEENGCMVSVGGLAMHLAKVVTPTTEPAARGIFGTLISFQRRALHLSVEKLAAAVNVGLEELFRIEDDSTYKPDPATVRRLAQGLKLPASQLLALSGNTPGKDEKVYQAALKFAARIREAEKLNSHQAKALHDFVQALTDLAA